MTAAVILLCILVNVGFIAWACYDSGYDRGWADRDQGFANPGDRKQSAGSA